MTAAPQGARRRRALLAAGLALCVVVLAALAAAISWRRLGPGDVVLWLPQENAGIDVPVSLEPGGPGRFLAVGRSDSAQWTVADASSSLRDRLGRAGLESLARGEDFEETGIVVRVGGVGWAQLRRSAVAPADPRLVPDDARDLVGRWEHVTGAGETRTLELSADGTANGLAPTLRWTRWRDRVAAGFEPWSGLTPSSGPDPVPRGGRDDAFDAVLSADRLSYEGADAVGRPVRGRRVDGATPSADSPTPPVPDLRFVGTVTAIGLRRPPDPGPGHRLNWVVTARVEQVLAGSFDGETFSFVVHSPQQEGLREGGRYVIDADRASGREFRFVGARPAE